MAEEKIFLNRISGRLHLERFCTNLNYRIFFFRVFIEIFKEEILSEIFQVFY